MKTEGSSEVYKDKSGVVQTLD